MYILWQVGKKECGEWECPIVWSSSDGNGNRDFKNKNFYLFSKVSAFLKVGGSDRGFPGSFISAAPRSDD